MFQTNSTCLTIAKVFLSPLNTDLPRNNIQTAVTNTTKQRNILVCNCSLYIISKKLNISVLWEKVLKKD